MAKRVSFPAGCQEENPFLAGRFFSPHNEYRLEIWKRLGGHTDTVRALLLQGADVNAKNNYGYTALWHANIKGNVEIIQMLKRAGAK